MMYFHIPFCKKRCIYCDFFSTVSKNEVVEAYIEMLGRELLERKDYLGGKPVETLYFGGGTPSQLSAQDFRRIFASISEVGFELLPDAEITIEANPDDLSGRYLASLSELPFNRISIGVQSFNDKELLFLNRRHTAAAAIQAVKLSRRYGFTNISIDLMYGLPNQSLGQWEATIRQALGLEVDHISAYHLIYEEDTPIYKMLSDKKITPVDEELSVKMFDRLIDRLTAGGFEHYEISNFAKPGYRSRHNASYWQGKPYLGIGAAAHSYNGVSRQWNVQSINNGFITYSPETELLDDKARYNDFVLTRLRTKEGIDLAELISLFGKDKESYCLNQAKKYIDSNDLVVKENRLQLTRKGIFVSDGIMSDLII